MAVVQRKLDGSLEGRWLGEQFTCPSRVSFGTENSKEKTLEWVTNPPVKQIDKRRTLQVKIEAMAENKGKWLVIQRAASSRTTVYYLRKRYPQLEVVCGKDETTPEGKWDIYARHRVDA